MCPLSVRLSVPTQASPQHPLAPVEPSPSAASLPRLTRGESSGLSGSISLSSPAVSYDICRRDHSVLSLQLPVTASVREVMAALAQCEGWSKGQVLVKVNSAGGELLSGASSLAGNPSEPCPGSSPGR